MLAATVVLAMLVPPMIADAAPSRRIDAVLYEALRYADSWWSEQGSPPPCAYHAQLEYAPLAATDSANADSPGCVIRWNITKVAWATAQLSNSNPLYRRVVLTQLCAITIHERGHNIGYQHTDNGGVMDRVLVNAPGGCVLWAARMVPRHSKRALSRSLG